MRSHGHGGGERRILPMPNLDGGQDVEKGVTSA